MTTVNDILFEDLWIAPQYRSFNTAVFYAYVCRQTDEQFPLPILIFSALRITSDAMISDSLANEFLHQLKAHEKLDLELQLAIQ